MKVAPDFRCPPEHEHGTPTCAASHHCKCEPCLAYRRWYASNRRKQQAYGRWKPHVAAETALAHVRMLNKLGMSCRAIAGAAGVDYDGLRRHMAGGRPNMRRPQSERLLAVKFDPHAAPPGAMLPVLGTRRRVEALRTLGWQLSEVARMIGVKPGRMWNMIYAHDKRFLSAKYVALVSDVYDQLSGRPAPDDPYHNLAREEARDKGFVPPLGWDDIDFDESPAV